MCTRHIDGLNIILLLSKYYLSKMVRHEKEETTQSNGGDV